MRIFINALTLGALITGLTGCAFKAEYYPLCNLRTCFDDPKKCAVGKDDLAPVSTILGQGIGVVQPEILRTTDNFVLIKANEHEHEILKRYWQSIACVTADNRVTEVDADRYWKCISSVPAWVDITTKGKLGQLFLDRNYRLACLRTPELRATESKKNEPPKEQAGKK